MEGVAVSAKRAGSTITVSVVTDEKGRYSFPAGRLEPGRYTLGARAAGYDLDGPKAADVTAGQAATADIKLKPTQNLPAQLTNAEWMMSMPGTDEQKTILLGCNGCHTASPQVEFAAGGNPFFGQPKVVNQSTYLGGGQDFGPLIPGTPHIVSRNLTPDKTGKPEGGRSFAEFYDVASEHIS